MNFLKKSTDYLKIQLNCPCPPGSIHCYKAKRQITQNKHTSKYRESFHSFNEAKTTSGIGTLCTQLLEYTQ